MGLGDGNWKAGGGGGGGSERYRLARGLYGTVCILAGQTVAFVLALKKIISTKQPAFTCRFTALETDLRSIQTRQT